MEGCLLQKREKTIAGDERQTLDAVVVGAGAGGLYALLRLKREGRTVRLFEAGSEVGGTWYWNNYPGARVDVPSLEYSYSFDRALQQEWVWPERYSAQPQLQAYFSHVADRYGLRDQITFETKVVSAEFDERRSLWKVRTDGGEVVWARFFIVATGPLSEPIFPKIEGMSTFKGTSVHTGRWKTDGADVAHKRVGVIGTGSSGAQIAPELAKTARKLHLLQRTPAYSVPSQNKVLDAQEIAHLKSNYDAIREHARANRSALGIDVNDVGAFEVSEDERQRIFEERWQYGGLGFTAAFGDLYLDVDANKTAADFVRQKIREIVEDADVADRLMPDTLIGAKRLCVDNGYFQMFNRDNVELVDLRENPLLAIDETGIVTAQGHIDLDVIVYATGFDAFTGSILKIDIRGRGGKELKAVWDSGPRTYLGLCVAGFPNMFIVNGPGSPAGLANMVTLAETEVDWIVDCIQSIDRQGKSEIEAIQEKQDCWGRTLNEMAEQTIYPSANSWYVGANVPGKPRNFMSHLDYPEYVRSCRASAESGYADFRVE